MTINYGGGAGGQPRLFIPTIDIPAMRNIQDPATKKAFEEVAIALNAIKRWSDMLLLGGGGGSGLLAFGGWTASLQDNTHPNPVTWTPRISDGVFNYMDAGVQFIQALPTHSYSIFQYGFSNAAGATAPTAANFRIFMLMVGAASSGVPGAVNPGLMLDYTGVTPALLEDGRSGWLDVDSDNIGVVVLPWHVDALLANFGEPLGMWLNISSWSKP